MKQKLNDLIIDLIKRGEIVVKDQDWIFDINIDVVLETNFKDLHVEIQKFVNENIIPLFIRLLKKRKLYTTYFNSNREDVINRWKQFPEMPIKDYVCDAFNWHGCYELNWSKLDAEWGKLLVNIFDCDFLFDDDDETH